MDFEGHVGSKGGAGCVISEMDQLVGKKRSTVFDDIVDDSDEKRDDKLLMDESESEIEQLINVLPDMYRVPIKPAKDWAMRRRVPKKQRSFYLMV